MLLPWKISGLKVMIPQFPMVSFQGVLPEIHSEYNAKQAQFLEPLEIGQENN